MVESPWITSAANSSGIFSRLSSTATRWISRPALAPMPLNKEPTLPSRIKAVTRAGSPVPSSGLTAMGIQRNGSASRFSCPAFSSIVIAAINASIRSR